MAGPGKTVNRGAGRWYSLRANLEALLALTLIGLAVWAISSADAGTSAGPPPTRIDRSPGKIVPDPGLDPPRSRRHGRPPHRPRPALDRQALPDLRHRRLLRPAARRRTRRLRSLPHPGLRPLQRPRRRPRPGRRRHHLRRHLGADHPPRALGRAESGTPRPALPLGRLRRRRRARLRQPPAPLLEPRPGTRIQAGRMGRSLRGRPDEGGEAESPPAAKPTRSPAGGKPKPPRQRAPRVASPRSRPAASRRDRPTRPRYRAGWCEPCPHFSSPSPSAQPWPPAEKPTTRRRSPAWKARRPT